MILTIVGLIMAGGGTALLMLWERDCIMNKPLDTCQFIQYFLRKPLHSFIHETSASFPAHSDSRLVVIASLLSVLFVQFGLRHL